MFTVYCPRHGSQVLLFSDNIDALVNGPEGVEVHWRCLCGQAGVNYLHRDGSHLQEAQA